MSMHEMEDFAEYAVKVIRKSSHDNIQKCSIIKMIYELEENGDCSFTKLRNIKDLVACGYTVCIKRSALPARIPKDVYEYKKEACWCVDYGSETWNQCVEKGIVQNFALKKLNVMETFKLILACVDEDFDGYLQEGALQTAFLANLMGQLSDGDFQKLFAKTPKEVMGEGADL